MRTLVLMPTYNEAEVIKESIEHLLGAVGEIDLLVIDDNSPDGTGQIADRLAKQNDRISVLHRERKQGLGEAYVAGFSWALAHGYELLVQMDSDGSHRPEDLPQLLQAAATSSDLVIGSRWIAGGEVRNWPASRQLISRFGNRYASAMLGSQIRDLTAGFRVYRADLLKQLPLSETQAHGYGFQVEMTYNAERLGARVVEVPITFVERESGKSKMTLGIVLEAFWLCTLWGLKRLIRR